MVEDIGRVGSAMDDHTLWAERERLGGGWLVIDEAMKGQGGREGRAEYLEAG